MRESIEQKLHAASPGKRSQRRKKDLQGFRSTAKKTSVVLRVGNILHGQWSGATVSMKDGQLCLGLDRDRIAFIDILVSTWRNFDHA
jgi:hypothetical protein